MKVPYHFPIVTSLIAIVSVSGFSSCAKVTVDPIEININVRVTVEKELDDFFGDLDQKQKTISE
jgi:hypothetical protein